MGTPGPETTHDWTSQVDVDHLARIRAAPALFAPGGAGHLILEVVAYAEEEAEANGGGRCSITLHADGSVTVSDGGRGTATVVDGQGRAVKKPVMVSRDLRFFDAPDAPCLPDGHPRRGISVVAALSEWLVHTNRRANGSWTQRYEHALPVTDLVPIAADGPTGTEVHFRPAEVVRAMGAVQVDELLRWTESPHLSVEVNDHRTHDGHVRLLAGTKASGEPAYEVVPAVRISGTEYEILGSPGLATGCAAGDRVRMFDDGTFEILTRGGNVCVAIYPRTPPDDSAFAQLQDAFEKLAGLVEAPHDKRFIVVTVPVSAGFPAIQSVVAEWTSGNNAEWYYGNVYDEDDRPLGWWESVS